MTIHLPPEEKKKLQQARNKVYSQQYYQKVTKQKRLRKRAILYLQVQKIYDFYENLLTQTTNYTAKCKILSERVTALKSIIGKSRLVKVNQIKEFLQNQHENNK